MRERKSRATTRRTRKSNVPKVTNRSTRTRVKKPRKKTVKEKTDLSEEVVAESDN